MIVWKRNILSIMGIFGVHASFENPERVLLDCEVSRKFSRWTPRIFGAFFQGDEPFEGCFIWVNCQVVTEQMALLNRCCFLNHDFNNFANWRSNFPKVHSVADVRVLFARITFPESNGLPVKIGHPGRKLHFLTVDFQGQTVSFREGSTRTVSGRVRLAPASRRFCFEGHCLLSIQRVSWENWFSNNNCMEPTWWSFWTLKFHITKFPFDTGTLLNTLTFHIIGSPNISST